MIRALLFDAANRPLRLQEYPMPVLSPGEMLVRVNLATICGSDWHTLQGKRTEPTPCVLGHEAVGTVVAVGKHASHDVNDRVVWSVMSSCGSCFFCRHDLPQKCESLKKYGHCKHDPERGPHGSFASHVHLWPGTAVVSVPPGIPDEVAAPASCATATVAACIEKIPKAETVLVLGCGLLGLTACAMLASEGKTVFAVDASRERRTLAACFGATAGDLPPRGVDAVLEFTGSTELTQDALCKLRIGGTIVLAGAVMPSPALSLDPQMLIRRCLNLHGVHNYHPRHLQTAVDFLANYHASFPFLELVVTHPSPGELESLRQSQSPKAVRHAIRFPA